MLLRRLSVLTVTLVALLAAGFTALPSSEATASTSTLGVFRGSGRPDLVQEYESWLGAGVGYAVDFTGRTATTEENPWSKIDDPSWVCGKWANSKWRLALSTAMLPNTNFSLEAGARGDYDAHWLSFAQKLVAGGCADTIVRLGWEFNGKFYPWAAGGQELTFASYWRRVVNTMRSVPGQQFLFDWTPLAGNTNANVEAAYPGDAYVDIIGLDAYDTSGVHTSAADRWNDQLNRSYGLLWHQRFAAQHNKPMSFPEWGLTVRPNDNLGGGDNPYYIQKMWEWIGSNRVLYAAYFEVDAVDASHRLMTTQFPNSSNTYRQVVAGSVSTTTTAAPTTTTTAAPTTTTTAAPTTTTTAAPTTTTTAAPTTTTTTAPTTTTTTTGTTVVAPQGVTIFGSAVPSRIASDTKSVELGVKFRSDKDGTITGVRFYKSAKNTGTHVGSLWARGGRLLAQATFTSETSSGWQEVRFAKPVAIKAGVTYVASYHTNTGSYAEVLGAFSTKGADAPPLHALRDQVDGRNGVFRYGNNPTFPNQGSKKAANYWVDVRFVPAA
jgi:hypothetical protein